MFLGGECKPWTEQRAVLREVKVKDQVTETITAQEHERLKALESVVKTGKQAFVEVGLALEEIRVKRLYRAEFKSFKDYCAERWGFTRARAEQLIWAAETVEALDAKTQSALCSSRAALALRNTLSGGPKTPKARRTNALLNRAAKRGETVTAKQINEASKPSNKPLPKGGLCADALRAQRGEPEPETPTASAESERETVADGNAPEPITLAEFAKLMARQKAALEAGRPEDAHPFAEPAMRFAEWAANFGKPKRSAYY